MVRLLLGHVYLAFYGGTVSSTSNSDPHKTALDIVNASKHIAPHAPALSDHHEKRKGGGGHGGGHGGSHSIGGSSRTSSSSYVGGSTRLGSGPSRSYGRGRYYGGGASIPYQAGSKSHKGLVAGTLLTPVAVMAIMPGLWMYSVYPYHYDSPYRFFNRTGNSTIAYTNHKRGLTSVQLRQDSSTGANETLPVVCLCQEFNVCGCDENSDQAYVRDLVGDGDYNMLNKSLVTVSDVNGTRTLVLNGTLPNGTTAPGGMDAAAAALPVGKHAGYWAMRFAVVCVVCVVCI